MSKLLELLVSLSAAGSAATICVLLLRFLSPDAVPASWRYRIGKVAIACYLLPVAIIMQALPSLLTGRTGTSAPVVDVSDTAWQARPLSEFSPVPGIPETTVPASLAFLSLSVWGIGALVFAGWQIYCYRKFRRALHQTRIDVPVDSEFARQLAERKEALGVAAHVRLAHSSAIRSPLLVGLRQPTMYLPVECAKLDLRMVSIMS